MKRGSLLLPAVCCLSAPLLGQTQRVYIANDDHTDYFWSALDTTYRTVFAETLDYYLNLADSTQGNPSDFQSRWNCDGSLWMWTYQQDRSPAQFQTLINRIQDGHISVPLNALVVCLGGTPTEAILRGMYYPGKIERQYGVRFRLAYAMENQTLPCGLASLWAGSGAKYSWRGICGCDTVVPNAGDREPNHEIYYAAGPDGGRVLLKWNSLLANPFPVVAMGMGGYAEARYPSDIIDFVTTNAGSNGFAARYPYNVIGCFGKGWDDVATKTGEFVTTAQTKSNASRRVIVSNETDFFQDFEAAYGSSLATQTVSFGNEWEWYCVLMSETSARVKRAVEKLRGAEAMASIVSRSIPTFMAGREASRDQAWMDLGLFWEHNWGMVFPQTGSGGATARIVWQNKLADEIDNYINALYNDSASALATLIAPAASTTRFYAFNPLGWTRSDYADLVYNGPTPAHVVDVSAGQEIPSQIVSVGGEQRLRIWCDSIPSVGYKVYEIQSGMGQSFSGAPMVVDNVLESATYRVTINGSGAITSLIDKTQSNREFIQAIAGAYANDIGSAAGTLSVENAGPVSITLRGSGSSPLSHSGAVTLYRAGNRVDITDQITQNFGDTQTCSFGFNLSAPDVHHEEVGAILRARLEPQGHYSSRTSNSRYDWLTLNHFADMTGAGNVGVTLSNADNYFMKLGNSSVSNLDIATPQITVLVGSANPNASIGNQGGATFFERHLALSTHGAYSPVSAMRMSLEHQNPLICRVITGSQPSLPATQFSFLTVTNGNVLLWALKPAEDGAADALTARLWNVTDSQQPTQIGFSSVTITSASDVTHIETPESIETVSGGQISPAFNNQQIRTFRLALSAPSGNSAPQALSYSVNIPHGTPRSVSLTAFDVDVPSQPLTYTIVGGPNHGAVSDFNSSAGTLTYTPESDFTGDDVLSFMANDGALNSNVAFVTLQVLATPNIPPIAKNQSIGVAHNRPQAIQLMGQDQDNGPAPLTYSLLVMPMHGTISGFSPASGRLTYAPSANYSGPDSFIFRVNDGADNSPDAAVFLTVLPPAPPPPPPSGPDADGDGISDASDQCPGTLAGGVVNAQGCADYQLDEDKDGVPDAIDHCPQSPADEPIFLTGCAYSQLDDDSDTVINKNDRCPGTLAGESVNADGCSRSQLTLPDGSDPGSNDPDAGQGTPSDGDPDPSLPSGGGFCGIGMVETMMPIALMLLPIRFAIRRRRADFYPN